MDYQEFIESKTVNFIESGFEVYDSDLNESLFDFQKFIVKTALRKGRFAIFADCGLGKTLMQLEWANKVCGHTQGKVLILAPLAVVEQTKSEALKFNIDLSGIDVINYEQLDNINCDQYDGVVLDESSILKNFTGKIKTKILDSFKKTKFKLACTATPSPNNILELGNHSDFLNVMRSNEMIARWFINDTMNFGGYRLKKHAEIDFYKWVSSWAIMLSKPSDIGFETEGYKLPDLSIIDHIVDVDLTNFDNGELIRNTTVNATNYNRELKRTQKERLQKTADLVNNSNESWIVWVAQNEESELITKMIDGAVEVKGSDKPDVKANRLLGFAKGEFRVLVTKKKIAQFGLNYQSCHNQVFCSVDFSFEGLYQAIRRSYRFGQKDQVNIHMIVTSSMNNVISNIYSKKDEFEKLQEGMKKTISEQYKMGNGELKMDYDFREVKNEEFHIMNGDSVVEIDRIEDNSLDFSIFSPPFSNLYIYSDSVRDMGNNENDNKFFEQYSYLVDKLYKKMRPGRLVAVHVKNLVNYKGSSKDGMAGQRDFRGENIKLFKDKGFSFHSEVTIWKDPVIEMQRTKAHGLLYKQLRKDSSFSRNGMAEYLLVFRKWAHTDYDEAMVNPVRKFDSTDYAKELETEGYKEFIQKCGDKAAKLMDWTVMDWQKYASPVYQSECSKNDLLNLINNQQSLIDYLMSKKSDVADNYASPVWMDINQTKVLNIKEAKSNKDEKHICPLQLDVIEKAIDLWTNPNDVVFTPFLGIGSEVHQAIKMGRRGIGIELKPEYFDKAVKNCKDALKESNQLELF
jgi:DNA modification methylase